ncbi:MAG: rod-binding protein [Sphingobium sp.]
MSGAGATKSTGAVDPEKLKVAQQFEAIFLRQMIGSMRSSTLAEGMFDTSASDQFRDMADARTADAMSQTGGLGIADMLMKQFGWDKPSAPTASPATALRSIAAVQAGSAATSAAALQQGETP